MWWCLISSNITSIIHQDVDSALKQSTATWKIVVGHHAIRSVSEHGDTEELIEQLLPILKVCSSHDISSPSTSFTPIFLLNVCQQSCTVLLIDLLFRMVKNVCRPMRLTSTSTAMTIASSTSAAGTGKLAAAENILVRRNN